MVSFASLRAARIPLEGAPAWLGGEEVAGRPSITHDRMRCGGACTSPPLVLYSDGRCGARWEVGLGRAMRIALLSLGIGGLPDGYLSVSAQGGRISDLPWIISSDVLRLAIPDNCTHGAYDRP